jgi:hypothetical protein
MKYTQGKLFMPERTQPLKPAYTIIKVDGIIAVNK